MPSWRQIRCRGRFIAPTADLSANGNPRLFCSPSLPANILFFKTCEAAEDIELEQLCTQQVWYYELPPPARHDAYTKTRPLRDEEFTDCITWWDNRVENEYAWKVPFEQLLMNHCNLDVKSPNNKEDSEWLPPGQLVKSMVEKERRILEIMDEIEQMLAKRE